MNALKSYSGDGSSSEPEEDIPMDASTDPEEVAKSLGLTINPISHLVPFASASEIAESGKVAIFDPKTKELKTNPRYEELFKPEVGS